jgi:hypothetical protein
MVVAVLDADTTAHHSDRKDHKRAEEQLIDPSGPGQ